MGIWEMGLKGEVERWQKSWMHIIMEYMILGEIGRTYNIDISNM
jgi:hypothetical protein